MPLGYSIRFGDVGLPFSIAALVVAIAGGPKARTSQGLIISSVLQAVMWVFLEMLHSENGPSRRKAW